MNTCEVSRETIYLCLKAMLVLLMNKLIWTNLPVNAKKIKYLQDYGD